MDIKQIVSKTIKKERKMKGLTQEAIANKWGMNQTQYSRYERGIY